MFKDVIEGKNAYCIPYHEKVNPDLYGVVIIAKDRKVYQTGDNMYEFDNETISKVLSLAVALQVRGDQIVMDRIGVNATGLSFISVMAIKR